MTADLHAVLVNAVRTQLTSHNMTQSELAVHAGITDKHISQLLIGKANGSIALWNKICTHLNINVIAIPLPPPTTGIYDPPP